MKKLLKLNGLFLTAGLIALMLVSCEKDSSTGGATEDELIGKWTIASSSVDMTIDGVSVVDFLVEALGITEEQAKQFEQIYTDELSMSGTIEFMADYTYEANFDGDVTTGTWKLTSGGKEMIMDEGTEDETTVKIVSANATKMVVRISDSDTEDIDEDGTDENLVYTIEMVLTK